MIKKPVDTARETQLDYLKLPFLKEHCRPFAAEATAKHWSHLDYLARLIELAPLGPVPPWEKRRMVSAFTDLSLGRGDTKPCVCYPQGTIITHRDDDWYEPSACGIK